MDDQGPPGSRWARAWRAAVEQGLGEGGEGGAVVGVKGEAAWVLAKARATPGKAARAAGQGVGGPEVLQNEEAVAGLEALLQGR